MKRLIITFCAAVGLMNITYAQTALDFDGTDDHVVLANEGNFDFTTSMTVEFWVKSNGFGLLEGLVTKGDDSWRVHTETNGTVKFAGSSAFPDFASTSAIDDNTWHHVAATYDGTTAKIYIDGVEESSVAANDPIDNSSFNVAIGNNLQSLGRAVQAQMDNVRIWSDARTATEITNGMSCEVEPNAQGLVAMYHFNDGIDSGANGSNTLLFDNSGNGNLGTLQNFALTGATSNFVTSNRTDYMSIQAALGSSAQADRMNALEAGDFDGDGFDDLLATTEGGAQDIYFNDGFGHFETPSPIANTIGGVFSVGDIDNDGDIDIVNSGGLTFKVYVNDGAGNFTEQTPVTMNGTGAINVTHIGDVNGDNLADIIIGNAGTNATDLNEIWINNGTAGNPSFIFLEGLNSSYGAISSIDIGDIDNDGNTDIAFSIGTGAAVIHNNSNNTTYPQGQTVGGYNSYVRLLDWNQDGHLDLVSSDGYNNWGVRVFYNDTTGTFLTNAEVIVSIGSGVDYFSYAPTRYADMNGDGFLDVITRYWGGASAGLFLSNGCTVTQQTSCDYKLGPADNSVSIGDYNGDGSPDVFCGARDRKSSVSLNFLTPISTPALSDITSSIGDEVCDGDQISIEATVSNTGTVQWFSNADGSNQIGTGSPFSPTAGPGTYEYYVGSENPNGCRSLLDTIEVIVNENPAVAINTSTSVTSLDCFGDTDGELNVDVTLNGTATSSSYLWDDASNTTTQNLTGVGAGSYSIVVTDDNGCTATTSGTVTEPTDLTASASATDVSCNGDTDGSIDLSVTGGTTSYTYQWDDATNSTTEDLSAVGAGTYNVTVTDANGCTTTATATVTEPDALVATVQATGVSCNGDTDGSVDLSVTGGTTAYTYQWDDAANSTTEDLSAVGPGTYNVTVTDDNGCTTTATATVTEPDALAATSATTAELNGNDGSIDLSVTGGTAPYTYNWTGPNGFTSTDEDPTNLEGGTYNVTITDDNGCVFTFEVIVDSFVGINENTLAKFNVYPNPSNGNFTIQSSENGSVNIVNTNGKTVYTTVVSNGKTTLQLSQLAHGVYTIQLTTNAGFQVKKLMIQ